MKTFLPLSIAVAAAFCFSSDATAAGKDAIKAEIVKSRPLVEGRRTPAILRLDREGGLPVLAEELKVVHTQPLHLLIVDPSLTDYHHEHPNPMDAPGEYIFTMTPRTSCGYRIWADFETMGSGAHYVTADIPGAKDCKGEKIDRTPSTVFENDNFRFLLEMDGPTLTVGKDTLMRMTVRDKKGRYIEELEPIMGAFAHMVGFYSDYNTIAHIHPQGEEPTSHTDRAGPTLKFHISPDREGFLKLFAQVKINGIVQTVPFGIEVKSDKVSFDDSLGDGWSPSMSSMSGGSPFADEEPLPPDHVPVGEPSKPEEHQHAAPAADVDSLPPDHSGSSGGLADLYKGHDSENTQTKSLYDNEEDRIMKNSSMGTSMPSRPTKGNLPLLRDAGEYDTE